MMTHEYPDLAIAPTDLGAPASARMRRITKHAPGRPAGSGKHGGTFSQECSAAEHVVQVWSSSHARRKRASRAAVFCVPPHGWKYHLNRLGHWFGGCAFVDCGVEIELVGHVAFYRANG
jgi:hypothetical protein